MWVYILKAKKLLFCLQQETKFSAMKNTIFSLILLSTTLFVLFVIACNKEDLFDPRDEVIGSYVGTMEYKHSYTIFFDTFNFDTSYQVSVLVVKKDSFEIEILHGIGFYDELFSYSESNFYIMYGGNISFGLDATFTPELNKLEINAKAGSYGGNNQFNIHKYKFEGYKD